jgi:hypothetical protein
MAIEQTALPQSQLAQAQPAHRKASRFERLRHGEGGFTAVEFALVALPFTMLLFGIIAVGLYFFVSFSLENAVEQASRLIRTGQAQTMTPPMTTAQFKTEVCNRLPSFVDCTGKIRIKASQVAAFGGASAASCVDGGGNLIPEPATQPVPGAPEQIILVTICYEWDLAGKIPFLKLGKMGNGAALITAATVFRTEPYN